MACLTLMSCTPAPTEHEGFAIYLTGNDIPPAQMEAMSHVDIAEEPVIALDDIVAYDAQTHEITLTSKAFDRIAALEVPVRGKSFVVCVDRGPLYWGAFWTPISSQSFDGVTIWKPLGTQGSTVVRIELGYPSSSLYGGEDPRNNPEVLASLAQAGKLVTVPPDALPHSMKGYELYSWQEEGQWHFALLTGTNRNKTLEEVVFNDDIVAVDGWVHIRVVGVDALNAVLRRLPQDEYVFWLADLRTDEATQGDVTLALPPEPIITAIREHAAQCGLEFVVATR